jgi:hypothetical protein
MPGGRELFQVPAPRLVCRVGLASIDTSDHRGYSDGVDVIPVLVCKPSTPRGEREQRTFRLTALETPEMSFVDNRYALFYPDPGVTDGPSQATGMVGPPFRDRFHAGAEDVTIMKF